MRFSLVWEVSTPSRHSGEACPGMLLAGSRNLLPVIPAQAGIQKGNGVILYWIPDQVRHDGKMSDPSSWT